MTRVLITGQVSVPCRNLPAVGVPGRTIAGCVLLSGSGPGSAHPGVGGEHDGALVVRVSEPAADGKATAATLPSVAAVFGVGHARSRWWQGPEAG